MTIEKAGKTMNEQIKNEIISKINRIEETQKEEKSFTVTDCRGHKADANALFITMQTEDGRTVREYFSLKSPALLINVLKACGVYRPDMTAGEVLQDLPGKSGRAVFLTDPDGETIFLYPIKH
jgi:hypothetical protein